MNKIRFVLETSAEFAYPWVLTDCPVTPGIPPFICLDGGIVDVIGDLKGVSGFLVLFLLFVKLESLCIKINKIDVSFQINSFSLNACDTFIWMMKEHMVFTTNTIIANDKRGNLGKFFRLTSPRGITRRCCCKEKPRVTPRGSPTLRLKQNAKFQLFLKDWKNVYQ